MSIPVRNKGGRASHVIGRPAAVFNHKTGVLIKLGEREVLQAFSKVARSSYVVPGYADHPDDITYMELPLDEDIVNRVYHDPGFIKELYEQSLPVAN